MTDKKQKINEKSKKIEEIVKYFESDDIDIDEAIEKYEQATKLVKEIEEVLKGYEARVSKIAGQ